MPKDVKKTQKKTTSKKVVNEKSKKDKKNNNIKEEIPNVKKVVKEEVVKEEVISKKNKIEKVKPDKEFKKVRNKERASNALGKIEEQRFVIIAGVVGFLIATLLFRCILWPDRIATLKDGTQPIANLGEKVITADDLYEDMKEYYSVNTFLNTIDTMILSKEYPEDEEMTTKINETAEYYYSMYEKNYGYSKETFLSQYGFESEAAFFESLTLDYRRNKYYEKYAESLVTDKEIDKYYQDEVFGDVDSKHMLVAIEDDGLTDSEAKKLAEEIIAKLNKGTSWDDVKKEYSDKITAEDLGYNAFNASLEATYLKECKDLKVGSYSKTPVLTSYGYHIVFKIAQKDKPKLKDVKDDIITILAGDKKEADKNLYYKSLISMRNDNGLEFVDTKLNTEYTKYLNQYK